MAKTVFIIIGPFKHKLEGVRRACLLLKDGQRRRKLFRCILDFCNKPRFPISRDEKIDLSFFRICNAVHDRPSKAVSAEIRTRGRIDTPQTKSRDT